MRQAITTKFFGPTNHRGSRIKAYAEAGSITINWDHGTNIETNHKLAAFDLALKLGWSGTWTGGGVKTGYVFVLDMSDALNAFEVPA